MKLLILWISLHSKKPLLQVEHQPYFPICYCIWKVPDERLFVRKEINCKLPDYLACAFADGEYAVKK